MLNTKVMPANILISSIITAAAIISFYSVYDHNVTVKNAPIFYDESLVVQSPAPAVKTAPKALATEGTTAVIPAKMPTEMIPPVLIPPKVISRILPDFPLSALGKGMQGTVILSVYIDEAGLPAKVETKMSSGYGPLDNAAVKSVSLWKFEPAKRGVQPISSWFEVPVVFRIK